MASGKTYFTDARWSQAKAAAQFVARSATKKAYFDNSSFANNTLLRVGSTVTNFYADLRAMMTDSELMVQMARMLVLKDNDTRKDGYVNVTHVVTSDCSQANVMWATYLAAVLGDGAEVGLLSDTPCNSSSAVMQSTPFFPTVGDEPQFMIAIAQLNQIQTVVNILNALESIFGSANINAAPDSLTVLNLSGYQEGRSNTGQMASTVYSVKQLAPAAYDFASLPSSWQSRQQLRTDDYFLSQQYQTDLITYAGVAAAVTD